MDTETQSASPAVRGRFQKECGAGGKRKSRRGCGRTFFSDVRHERFCVNCKESSQVKARRNRKRRLEYREDRKRQLAFGRSRAVARKLLIEETPAQCVECPPGTLRPIKELECDHKDNNPMNNARSNRQWLCESHHKSKTRKDAAMKAPNTLPVSSTLEKST